ncbi:hypothetical protein, partial [Klebsiella pneumoniae]|uniref:hypothetical protein n=1 Tax=Klebsiella pneumoniae TaxID=573 RepID=UPI001C6A6FD4
MSPEAAANAEYVIGKELRNFRRQHKPRSGGVFYCPEKGMAEGENLGGVYIEIEADVAKLLT